MVLCSDKMAEITYMNDFGLDKVPTDPFGIKEMLSALQGYSEENGFECPMIWLGKRGDVLVPFAVPLHLFSTDKQFAYDGHVVFVLNNDVANKDRVHAFISKLAEPILLTVQLKEVSQKDTYEGVGMKIAPTRWSDDNGNEYEVYMKGEMDMETFGQLMQQIEYIGSNIIYKDYSTKDPIDTYWQLSSETQKEF